MTDPTTPNPTQTPDPASATQFTTTPPVGQQPVAPSPPGTSQIPIVVGDPKMPTTPAAPIGETRPEFIPPDAWKGSLKASFEEMARKAHFAPQGQQPAAAPNAGAPGAAAPAALTPERVSMLRLELARNGGQVTDATRNSFRGAGVTDEQLNERIQIERDRLTLNTQTAIAAIGSTDRYSEVLQFIEGLPAERQAALKSGFYSNDPKVVSDTAKLADSMLKQSRGETLAHGTAMSAANAGAGMFRNRHEANVAMADSRYWDMGSVGAAYRAEVDLKLRNSQAAGVI